MQVSVKNLLCSLAHHRTACLSQVGCECLSIFSLSIGSFSCAGVLRLQTFLGSRGWGSAFCAACDLCCGSVGGWAVWLETGQGLELLSLGLHVADFAAAQKAVRKAASLEGEEAARETEALLDVTDVRVRVGVVLAFGQNTSCAAPAPRVVGVVAKVGCVSLLLQRRQTPSEVKRQGVPSVRTVGGGGHGRSSSRATKWSASLRAP